MKNCYCCGKLCLFGKAILWFYLYLKPVCFALSYFENCSNMKGMSEKFKEIKPVYYDCIMFSFLSANLKLLYVKTLLR